jgi:nucleotide-binding universal stress UspA family protein
MPDTPEEPTVRITVPSRPSGSDDEPYLRSGPPIQSPEYIVVVPVTDALLERPGINVRQFLRTAVALAADNDGRVLLVGIETVGGEAVLDTVREHVQTAQPTDGENTAVENIKQRQTQLAEMANVAQELDPEVSVNAVVRAVTDSTQGILDIVDGDNETVVLLLGGTGLDEGWLLNRSTIDALLAESECDVFVENMGTHAGENALYVPDVEEHTVASLAKSEAESIESILLPVGTGPHAALAAEAARAVARASGASITVLHVISSTASAETRADGEDLLKFAAYVLGSEVAVETELKEASDTTDTIVQEAKTYDFVSIGFPEQKSRLKQLVFGSVQETLSELRGTTVLMSRDSNRTMRSLYYRWKRGITSAEDDGDSGN